MFHFLIALLLVAQPLPEPPATTFAQHCYTLSDEGVFTLYFGYLSNSERHFVGDGFDFITHVGEYPDALSMPAGELPAPNLSQVSLIELLSTGDPALDAVTGSYGEQVVLVLDWSSLPECGHEDEMPNPLPTAPPNHEPMPIDCDTWALDGSTGEPYCYEAQPNGVIPLPPPLTGRQ